MTHGYRTQPVRAARRLSAEMARYWTRRIVFASDQCFSIP